jgi:hypothetical protein
MGLSDEGLVIVLVLMWVPLLVGHFFIVRRAMKLVRGVNVTEFTRNLVSMVTFILILSLYVIVCTVSMFTASQDRETSRTTITFIAELIWWFSPIIATLSILKVSKNTPFHNLIPANKEGWILCVKRSFVFGIPLCAIYAVGDQFLRQIISYLINQDADVPIPIDFGFLQTVGESLGYAGGINPKLEYLLGFVWNITIGPFVNLFSPAMESVYEYGNGYGVGLYFFYAIPEEIGWTGALYPMMLGYFAPDSQTIGARFTVLKAMAMTGLIWGMWHCPYIVLKWNPSINTLSSFVYNILFVFSCIATRFVLISLVWPIASSTPIASSSPLNQACVVPVTIRPSLVPAIYAHAAMNVWWNFYNSMYMWSTVPTWSILVGSEYSVTSVLWQLIIGLLLVRPSWSSRQVSS